ncbi:unnamed protein product [Choristocarpus tenellus]
MRVVIQRVKEASVVVDGWVVSEIGKGIMCLVGISEDDGPAEAEWMCRQVLAAKLFPGIGEENAEKMWRSSVKQNNYEVLLVSQFTLSGRVCKKGGKVDFTGSMRPDAAHTYYQKFVDRIRAAHEPGLVKDGVFGAKMEVPLTNDGPVTIIVDSKEMKGKATKGADGSKGVRAMGSGLNGEIEDDKDVL